MTAFNNILVYTLCSGVLYLKFFVVTFIQGGKSFEGGGRAPEDQALISKKNLPQQTFYGLDNNVNPSEKLKRAKEVEARWRRIVMNDIESIPFAMFIFAGGVLAKANKYFFAASMITYTVSRCLHSIAFAYALQPYRSILWIIGVVSILVGAGSAIYSAIA